MTGISAPFSLADLTNNVGLLIWATIGAVGLLAGFISVNVVKRRSVKNMQSTSIAGQPAAQADTNAEPQAPSAASAPEPSQASSSSDSYSAASTASSSATHESMGHLTRAG